MKYGTSIISFVLLCATAASGQEHKWTLKDCIDYAVRNNITIQKSVLDKSTADLNYRQSRYNKLPSVSGSAGGSLSNGSTIDPVTSDFVDRQILSNNFGITGQLTLYQGNTLNLRIEKNEILVKQSELYVQEARNNITLSVLEAYLQALYYYEGIRIAENALNSSAEELKQAQTKFENGAIARLELADLETQHSNNEYSLVTGRNAYNQQVLALKQLLELDPSTGFEIENIQLEEVQTAIPNKQEVFAKAAGFLPDLKIYDLSELGLQKDIALARAAYKPTLSLSAGINSGYTNTMDFSYSRQLRSNFSQQLGLTLSVPIFSRFQNRTNVDLAKIQLQQNQLDKVAAAKTLYSRIETIYQNAVANTAQQNASKTARDNAALSYQLAGKKYEFGALTPTELAVSRNTFLNAEQTYLQSKYLAALYQQLLKFYEGGNITEYQ